VGTEGLREGDYDLARFVEAQEDAGNFERALTELRGGRKTTHWMWFVFPQLAGLGQSPTSRHFAISSLGEARAYLDHETLGPRLLQCAAIVADLPETSALAIFGPLDAQKLRSSMTLFLRAAPEEPTFRRVLDRFFGGESDPFTDRLLAEAEPRS